MACKDVLRRFLLLSLLYIHRAFLLAISPSLITSDFKKESL